VKEMALDAAPPADGAAGEPAAGTDATVIVAEILESMALDIGEAR
jgi:hypothetical protein